MEFDFGALEDVESFELVPPGTYVCRVAEVREGRARDGSSRWSLRLEVADGDLAGRTAAWDSLTWSARGVHRVRRVLAAFGVDVRGVVQIEAQDLHGLRAWTRLEPEEVEDALTGRRRRRLRVPYDGYRPEGTDAPGEAETDGAPAPDAPWNGVATVEERPPEPLEDDPAERGQRQREDRRGERPGGGAVALDD